ncbi:MAG: tRNA (adenosine(37)-N6)-threonylcarbamoyltransferase complex dimerization subunit type 1 TsaB [Defluviitaleaceae bacterium]|nr:tRNA (adenosine(37)-N6)-threonylcarbamoyltransferase complex dimerization subunit type 1 TsaB [Defluviitaleaceae bacterium]MCL2273600.1 tRNA (adenosine(37)-N6)-threonylcarbamoyltransferase complex dimerization subunit type 1 TsaB [Defluviitaleaceae bacterium]
MKILAIDTSSTQAGVAVVQEGNVLGKIIITATAPRGHGSPNQWKHSQVLIPAVENLLEQTKVTLLDIHCIAYTCGPGSFTGLRIAAAAALGLAHGAKIPVVQVPTLDAMAYAYIAAGHKKVVPMLDARRGQVYAAIYENGKRITDYLAAPAEEVLLMAGDALVIKDAVCPAAVGLWAGENFDKARPTGELLYVRAPQAVREMEKKKA